MASGQVLHILTTDPGSVRDFQAFAKQTGNELLATEATEATDPMFEFFLKRK
jgi:tRNA 2-thiouridine synthesizing protein A